MISRERAIETLTAERFDVAVIGGGVTGAGVALEAASRGYSVAFLERADFAAGTSSRSSKLIHGGLRYLQNFDLGLVREALLERQLLVKLPPHLVKPLPIVVAAFEGARPDRLTGIGLNMCDVMAAPWLGRPGVLGRRARRTAGQPSGSDPWLGHTLIGLGLIAGRAVASASSEAPARVARALCAELDWGEQRMQDELARFAAEAHAEGIAG